MASSIIKLKSLGQFKPYSLYRSFSISRCCRQSVETIPVPGTVDSLQISPKIDSIVNEITKLTLIEVSELNSALKKKLNLPDAPTMAFGAVPLGAQAAVTEEEEAPQAMKVNFTLKLQKYDDTKKVALIKEIKNVLDDMNLVQAKKFIESAPVIVKSDISKDEAEKLKELLAKHGAECSID